jgi:asparagine synthase (glutamine-hydrolysing)
VEHRPPFLSHELVELAFRVRSDASLRGGGDKWLLKEIARKHLPARLVDRRKVGFRVPLGAWFRSELREFAHDLLLGPDSFVCAYLDGRAVARLVDGHQRGRRNEELRLWTLLGLEVWHRTFLRGAERSLGAAQGPTPESWPARRGGDARHARLDRAG